VLLLFKWDKLIIYCYKYVAIFQVTKIDCCDSIYNRASDSVCFSEKDRNWIAWALVDEEEYDKRGKVKWGWNFSV
jgi:hypothetical protein